jgi:hypothetical protein
MKTKITRVLAILLLVLPMVFLSCEKDEDSSSVDTDKIIGLWNYQSVELDATVNGKTPIAFVMDEFDVPEVVAQVMVDEFMDELEDDFLSEFPNSIDIKANGTYVVTFTDSSTDNGDWEVSGDKLIVDKGSVYEMQMTIVSLTDTKLIVKLTDSQKEDITEDGIDETMSVTATITYIK